MSDFRAREDAYDAWTRTVGVSNVPGGGLAMSPLDAWRAAWQASRAAALEEVHKMLISKRERYIADDWDNGFNGGIDSALSEIRALLAPPAGGAR